MYEYKKKLNILATTYIFLTIFLLFLFSFKKILISIICGLLIVSVLENIKHYGYSMYYLLLKNKNSILYIFFILFFMFVIVITFWLLLTKISIFFKYLFDLCKLESIKQIVNVITSKFIEIITENENESIKYELLKNSMKYILEQSHILILTIQERITDMISLIFTIFLTLPFILYFYFKNRYDYLYFFLKFFNKKEKKKISYIIIKVFNVLHVFITRKLYEFLIIFILSTILFYFLDIPYNILFSLYFSIWYTIIPFIGIITGFVPILFISYIYSYKTMIFIIIGIFEILILNDYIHKKLFSNETVNILFIQILLFVTWKLFGFGYMIFTVPVYLIYKVIFDEIIDT